MKIYKDVWDKFFLNGCTLHFVAHAENYLDVAGIVGVRLYFAAYAPYVLHYGLAD